MNSPEGCFLSGNTSSVPGDGTEQRTQEEWEPALEEPTHTGTGAWKAASLTAILG